MTTIRKTLPLYEAPRASALNQSATLPSNPACELCERHAFSSAVCMKPERTVLTTGTVRTVLVVNEAPSSSDGHNQRPMSGQVGGFIRALLQKHWKGTVIFDHAVRCAGKRLDDKSQKVADACRPYLAHSVGRIEGLDRVLVLGKWASYGVLGRRVPMHSVDGGYGWHIDPDVFEETGDEAEAAIPVYLLQNPELVVGNRFLRRDFERSMERALTRPAPPYDPTRRSVTHRVLDEGDAIDAYSACTESGGFAYDVETSGEMWNADFRIESLTAWPIHVGREVNGIPSIDAVAEVGWTWTREAIEDRARVGWLRQLLQNDEILKGGLNTKYDNLSALADAALRARVSGRIFDARLIRKLLDPGVDGDLETNAELVGMGGHKHEAHAMVKAIDHDLNLLAGEDDRKSLASGKPRQPVKLSFLDRSRVNPEHVAKLRANPKLSAKAFAYHYLDPEVRDRYNGLDACSTGHLLKELVPRLQASPNLSAIHEKVVTTAAFATTRMEEWGVAVDRQNVVLFDEHLQRERARVQLKLDAYGKDVNWGSPAQLADVLFKRLKLPYPRKAIDGKQLSTDAGVLSLLAQKHALPAAILEMRHFDTMDRYAGGMLPYIRDDGRIHTSYLLDGTECMPAGELVLTARGYLPVEEVKVGDTVLTHKGRARKVTRTVKNNPEPIYGVSLANGARLRVNAKHPFRVGDEWVEAQHLVQGAPVSVHSDEERWALIPGWRGYEVSTWGRVRNVHSQKLLAQQPKGRWGHLKVSLKRNGARERGADFRDFAVHRLVLLAHRGPDAGEVRHLNGIAWDNTLANLAYGTRKENALDSVAHGTMSHRGAHNGQRKLTEAAAQEIRMRAPLTTHAALAREFNVSRELVRDVCAGKRWQEKVYDEPRASFGVSTVLYASRTGISEATYGLTVEEDHSHVTGGIVTHNTGRPSGRDPNLLNIPRGKGSAEGRMARNCFIAPPGKVLFELDMSQQELRVAAWLSGDPVMIDLFNQPDADFHSSVLDLVCETAHGVPRARLEELKAAAKRYKAGDASAKADADTLDELRSRTKAVVFGTGYGKVASSFAREWDISLVAAERMVEAILGPFVRYRAWMKEQIARGRVEGGVHTYWDGQIGRWRPLYAIADQGDARKGARENAERSTINTPIQGTAAEFVTASLGPMIDTFEDEGLIARGAKLVLTVYDSIMGECFPEDLDSCVRIGRHIMTSHDSGPVRLRADCKAGTRWGELTDYEPAAA